MESSDKLLEVAIRVRVALRIVLNCSRLVRASHPFRFDDAGRT